MDIKKIIQQDENNVVLTLEKIETEERVVSNEQLIEQLKVIEKQYDSNVEEISQIELKNEEHENNINIIKEFVGVEESVIEEEETVEESIEEQHE